MGNKLRVVVGLSGGVDSSFAAATLKEQGYEVIGVMLRLWSTEGSENENRCCSPDAMMMARRVSALLDIPFYAVDARDLFRGTVVEYMLQGYGEGITPNPCLICNEQVRWKMLLHQADLFDAQFIATGHYARIERDNPRLTLLRGIDRKKDQSYVLARLPLKYLERTLLPVGDFEKSVVRKKCSDLGLPVASRPDSQDLCFLGNETYRDFYRRYSAIGVSEGDIVDETGKTLGKHNGLIDFTPGQRKGIRLASKEPLYVLAKDMANNRLIVGDKDSTKKIELYADRINWLIDPADLDTNGNQAQVRYSAKPEDADIMINGDQIAVKFMNPVSNISPGQAVVVYHHDQCLCSGIIV